MKNQITYSPHPIFAAANRRILQNKLLTAPRLEDTRLATILRANLPDVVFDDVRVYVNDEWIPTEAVETYEVKDGDHIIVRQRVHGGDSSNPLQIILTIAIIALAVYTGGLGAGALGFEAGSLGYTVASTTIAAAVTIAGTLVVNALFPPAQPSIPGIDKSYSITGQSNRARINEPLPLVVGRHKIAPDLGANPFTTQTSEDIFLHQVFNFGFGNLVISDVKIGDTLIENYEEVETEWSDSNGNLNLFPTNVDQIPGAALNYEDDWITRTTSIDTTRIEVDIAGTLFATDKEGKYVQNDVVVEAQYRAVGSGTWENFINTAGQPPSIVIRMGRLRLATPGIVDGAIRLINDDTKPFRKSLERVVPKGQYEVRLRRLTETQTSRRHVSELSWTVMKCYQVDDTDYKGQTRLGVRIRATGQLQGTIQELNAIVSARIPVWNNTTWVTQESSNPAYIFLYLARGARDANGKRLWGAGLPDNRIDIDLIKEWGAWCAAKGLECNYIFGQKMSIAEMLQTVARCGRAGITWQKGILGIVYDKENLPITQVFGMSNIVEGSFNISYLTRNLADEIVLKFVNEDRDFETDEIRVPVIGITTPINPVEVEIPGVTTVAQAAKEAKLLAARQHFHRRTVSFNTDFEGLVCGRGDVITVSHDLTNWGVSGRLVSGTTTSLVLDRDVTFTSASPYYLGVRYPSGTYVIRQVVNPYAGSPVTTNTVTLTTTLPSAPSSDTSNLPHDYLYFFDPQATPGKRLKIISVAPSADQRVSITAIDDVLEYYDEENGSYDYTAPPVYSTDPAISDISVTEKWQGFGQPLKISIVWKLVNASAARLRIRTNGLDWVDYGNIQGSEFNYLIAQYKNGDQLEVELTPVQLTGLQKKGGSSVITYFITGEVTGAGNVDVPTPSGLELYNAANGNEFTGRDAKFVWRRIQLEPQEFGSETLGADTGAVDALFEDYEIRIFNENGTLRRKEYTKNEEYTYTYEKNAEDGSGTAARTFRIAVYYRTKLNQISAVPAQLLVTNPAPAAPSGLSVSSILKNLYVIANRPSDLDLVGMKVWVDTQTGFTPGAGNLKHTGPETAVTIDAGLNYDTTYYVKVAFYDGFGDTGLNYSPQVAITPTQLDDTDVQVDINTRPGLINTDDWVSPPTDPMNIWDLKAGSISNSAVDVSYNGPFQEPTPALIVSGTSSPTAPGWFSKWHVPFSVSATRGYVAYVWVMKKSAATSRGLYLGWTETTGVATMAGSLDGNPYFVSNAGSTMTENKWYLAVGVLNANAETVSSDLSGLWDPDTGERLVTGSDYKHLNGTINTQEMRMGFYSNTTTFGTADGFVFARPIIYAMDGAEPSITGLLRRAWGQGLLATLDTITAAEFAAGIRPVEIVNSLPTTGNFEGRIVYLTTDNKMYRHTGSPSGSAGFTAAVSTADLSGTINLNSQVSGTLTQAFADAGLINSNITVNADGTLTGAGGGQPTLNALTGQVSAAQVAANAIIAGKIAAGAVTVGTIAAGAVTTSTMTANTINGDRIAANTLDASKITADSITAGQIAAGAIGADEIAANAILASKIAITNGGRANNRNPQMNDLNAWYQNLSGTSPISGSALWAVTTQSDGPVGTSVLRYSGSSVSTLGSELIPVDPNKQYRVSVWGKQSGSGTNYISVAFLDANQSNIQGSSYPTWPSYGSYNYFGRFNQAFPGSWTKYEQVFGAGATATIPSHAKFMTIGNLTNFSNTAGTTIYLSDFRVEEVVPGVLIQDGAITANKINVANLSAIKADMGAITAGTITLDSTGYIRSGQSWYNTGTGFWLGKDGATTKFSIGSSTKNMRWDGSNLNLSNADVILDNGSVKRQLGTGFGSSNQFIDWFGPTGQTPTEANGTFYIKTNGEAYFGGDIRESFKTRAWARFYGTSVAYFTRQFNFSAITKAGTGRYSFTFTTPMPNKYYCVIVNASNGSNIDTGLICATYDVTTTGFKVALINAGGNYRDTNLGHLVVYGSDEVVTDPPPGYDWETDPTYPPGTNIP